MITRKLLLGLTAIAITFVLAACDASTPGAPTPTTLPASPTPPPAPTPAPASINFDTSGGIDGRHTTLNISATGEATYTMGNTTNKQNLPMTKYATLLRQIETADFFNLQDIYDSGTVSDDVFYAITIQQGDRMKKVVVAEIGGRELTPQALLDFISQLNAIQDTLEASAPTPGTDTTTTIAALKTGGIAGVHDTLIIAPGGQAHYSSRDIPDKTAQLPVEQYNALLAQIDKADFFNLQDTYDAPADDAFNYEITVTRGGRTKTVSITQTSVIPEPVEELLVQLTAIATAMEK